jgi:hypothetical protein
MAYELNMRDDGILRAVFLSDIEPEELQAFQEQAMSFIQAGKESGQPLCVLVDARQAGKMDPQTRRTVIDLDRENPEGKVAMLGLSPYVRVIVMLVNKALGKENVRFFGTEEEALAWLKEGR